MKENQIPIEQLPVTIEAFEDDNGFAVVITSEDRRISDSKGNLVNNFLVRIARGDVPKTLKAHPVAINEKQSKHVTVAETHMDEAGRLFVTDNATGEKHLAQ